MAVDLPEFIASSASKRFNTEICGDDDSLYGEENIYVMQIRQTGADAFGYVKTKKGAPFANA